MSRKGLPLGLKMRHDSHYVDELTKAHNFIGRTIQLTKIEPNPEQPRVEMGDLSDLVASIKEKGVLEPLLVKPLNGLEKWMIIAGERRWRAAQIAGLTELPCIELNIDEREIAEIALIENLQRKDLTIWEEADAYQALCDRFQYTHEDLAKKLGKSRSSVTETLTIASLPSAIRQKCLENSISSKAAILKIARKFDEDEMLREIDKNLRFQLETSDNASDSEKSFEKNTKSHSRRVDLNHDLNPDANLSETPKNLNVTVSSNFPLRVFKFNDEEHKFKAEIKFKKPATINDLENAVNTILEDLKKQTKTE